MKKTLCLTVVAILLCQCAATSRASMQANTPEDIDRLDKIFISLRDFATKVRPELMPYLDHLSQLHNTKFTIADGYKTLKRLYPRTAAELEQRILKKYGMSSPRPVFQPLLGDVLVELAGRHPLIAILIGVLILAEWIHNIDAKIELLRVNDLMDNGYDLQHAQMEANFQSDLALSILGRLNALASLAFFWELWKELGTRERYDLETYLARLVGLGVKGGVGIAKYLDGLGIEFVNSQLNRLPTAIPRGNSDEGGRNPKTKPANCPGGHITECQEVWIPLEMVVDGEVVKGFFATECKVVCIN